MRHKLIFLTTGLFLFFVVSGLYNIPQNPAAQTYELEVVNVDGVWKVVYAADHSKTGVRAKKNDVIVWTVTGTDASFQFPEGLLLPVTNNDKLKDNSTILVRDGKKLKLKINNTAEPGIYEYAIFCIVDGVFAIENSPPKIIIE